MLKSDKYKIHDRPSDMVEDGQINIYGEEERDVL